MITLLVASGVAFVLVVLVLAVVDALWRPDESGEWGHVEMDGLGWVAVEDLEGWHL